MLGLLVHPVLALTLPRERRELRMQKLVHRSFQGFCSFMRWVGVVEVHVEGWEQLPCDGGVLLVANHPTLLDYVLLVALLPQADCVVKRAHWSNPFTAGVVRGAGYIPNDGGEATVEACAARLRAGRTLLPFPEGTRAPLGGLAPFERGAAHVALAAGVAAIPVAIRCEPRGLMRGQPWYDVPESRMRFTLAFGPPIAADGLPGGRARAARALTARYRAYFEARSRRGHGAVGCDEQ